MEIESDNFLLISVIQNGLTADNNHSKVRLIKDWYFKDWEVKYTERP